MSWHINCKQCGDRFAARSIKAKFCSSRCKQRAFRGIPKVLKRTLRGAAIAAEMAAAKAPFPASGLPKSIASGLKKRRGNHE